MAVVGEWAVSSIIKAILQFVVDGLKRLAQDYAQRKEDEKTNREIREGVENAQTDEELQDALEEAGNRFGRR